MAKQKDLVNREVSWLSFNERVLQEAAEKTVPIVERLKFLGIFSNNLDEFFRVRVATQRRLLEYDNKGIKEYVTDKPKKVIEKIQRIVQDLQKRFDAIFQGIIVELTEQGIHLVNENSLTSEHATFIRELFRSKIAASIAPIMLNKLEKFPELTDRSIYLAVKLSKKIIPDVHEYALIEIPTADFPRFIHLPDVNGEKHIIMLDDVIRFCLDNVFSILPYDNFEAYTIKITRDAELEVDNDIAESLLEKISKSVKNRRKGQPVRFVYDSNIATDLLAYIIKEMDLDEDDNLLAGGRYHNFRDFMDFPFFSRKELVNEPLPPVPIPRLEKAKSMLEEIEKKDISLHYPYHSFSYYTRMLREAAIDPRVISIKITLYRVATESKVVRALMNAAQNGKSVTVVIELMARFDEGANIYWSKKMEEAGIKVIFGIYGLKVHSKMTLITREEDGKTINYTTLSTGNFHEGNANLYTDFSVITADRRITSEVEKVFTFLEFNFKTFNYRHLLVAPSNMRRKLYLLIDAEIANARKKLPAYIHCKINNIVDQDVIRKLYQASQAGVKIKLMVRGICSIVPGIPGQSENIEVVSVVDRFLEHSRIFVFCNNNHPKYYISSADWMTRNLDHRVEVAAPVFDPDIQKELRHIMNAGFKDNVKARVIDHKQSNTFKNEPKEKPFQSQIELHRYYTKKNKLK
ncbi:MAG TPA: RNA degradosome polyphosphate kinase [Tenuifilaceae bacterium]|nr:RNA degradosome polyphosphate kinase [Tenuifilaceae bacterium]HPE18221.1 RNA degradosome polyphosphate kinase [Tenuifilaceae bacterium]HPJ45504.1 RNA degradosome polyphosphate kinase [Tenuifilaceae bacterium]HPQ33911.1 RNA degradosome polyphosphate kinase [Tenuifilaceae bacterium]HRX68628.1 RNA degradosome polyphosphate kinase [Tenuifilaceae bacterium]